MAYQAQWGGVVNLLADGTMIHYHHENSNLPSNRVIAIEADKTGGIWVLTYSLQTGVTHLEQDGSMTAVPVIPTSSGQYSTEVIAPDKEGGVWLLSHASGITHFSKSGHLLSYSSENSDLPNNRLSSVHIESDGRVWVGGVFGLAYLTQDDTWQIFNFENSGISGVQSIVGDDAGRILVITGNSIVYLTSGRLSKTFLNVDTDLPGLQVTKAISDRNGGLLIGTEFNGLIHFRSTGKWSAYTNGSHGLPDNHVTNLLLSHTGQTWIGTQKGLAHLTTNVYSPLYTHELAGLPDDIIFSLHPDTAGGLWAGSMESGLIHMRANGEQRIYHKENSPLPNNQVNSIISDGENGIWVGTSGGLVRLKQDRSWEVYTKENSGLSDNFVNALVFDQHKRLWIGTDGKGLSRLGPSGEWDVYHTQNSELPNKRVLSLLSNAAEGLWIGTFEGLALLKNDHFLSVMTKTNTPLLSDAIYCLAKDALGNLWMGTTAGLACLNSDQSIVVYNSGAVRGWNRSLLRDLSGGIWVGNEGRGVTYFNADGRMETFTTSNSGLPNNQILSLSGDHAGGVWMGTGGYAAGGLIHFMLLGKPEQAYPESSAMHLKWFLNRSPIENLMVKYIELQRSTSKNASFETILTESGLPIRFNIDYENCPEPLADDCWPSLEGHTPAIKGTGNKSVKGYTLDVPVIDPDWLEGVPRYYRLSAVILKDGKRVRAANKHEAVLVTPSVKERPRVKVTLEKTAIALQPGSETEMSVFISSLDLFSGEVRLQTESTANWDISLSPENFSLSTSETISALIKIKIPDDTTETTSSIQILPTTSSEFTSEGTSLQVQVETSSMIALGIVPEITTPRVMDGITVSGNIVPPLSDQEIIIMGEGTHQVTLMTDMEGNFEGSVIPIKSGNLTLTAEHNGLNSAPVKIYVTQARTHISLTSNVTQNTKKGEILSIQGILAPARLFETRINLDIRYLDPLDPEGNWQPQFVGPMIADESGKFSRDVVVPGNGFIKVKADIAETIDFLAVNTELMIPIGQPVGEGIIVVSESGSNEYQEISKTLGSFVYHALTGRNIPTERIQYLGISYDSITAGPSSKSALQNAITGWAVSLMATDDPYKTPLNLYLVGRVEGGNFKLNDDEILTPEELGQWLDEAERALRNISPDSKGFPITIVLEGSQSGGWIEKVAGVGRFILTSSTNKPLNEGGYAGYEGNGEYSFSRYFYQYINYGSDIDASYAEANYEILKFYRHIQRPQMDADGDGNATTELDRYAATHQFIEYRPIGNLRPKVKAASTAKTIKGKVKSSLWAIATDPENDILGVYCFLVDPIGETMTVNLEHEKGDMYKAIFNGYIRQGDYRLVYFAKDMAGNVSLPKERFVNVIEAIADGLWDTSVKPDNSHLVSLNTPNLSVKVDGLTAIFNWNAVPNATGYNFCFDLAFENIQYDGEFFDCIDIGNIYGTIPLELWNRANFHIGIQAYNEQGTSPVSNVVRVFVY